ncbi:MAG: ATP-dependent helicase RecG [Actinomycetota bacterium]|nr:ATP-dependent helicase RecG [Actinomycetota bacterium]
MLVDLNTPLRDLVGDKTAKAFDAKLGLRTAEDLLRHYPRRYASRGELTDLASLREGEEVTVLARVQRAAARSFKNRRGNLLEVTVTDGTGVLRVTFFGKRNQQWLADKLQGRVGLFSGTVDTYQGTRQLVHPDYVLLDDGHDVEPDMEAMSYAGEIIPIYPAAAKLETWKIQKAVGAVLNVLGELPDPLPDWARLRRDLVPLSQAFRLIHEPLADGDPGRARKRLRYDEAFALQVILAQRRAVTEGLPAIPRRAGTGGLLAEFDRRLPFELTEGQRQVSDEIAVDLAKDHPMHRLLQGEVGSGKTVVALRAMLAVVDAGGQAALLAPTEVLAQQHHRSITGMLGDLAERGLLGGAEHGTRVALLTGSQPTAVRRQQLLDIVSGDAGIVIGTHALIQDKVDFQDLGLVVVDEQHRFGVEQRDALRAKARTPPHLLVMTATPIPRTVAMTVFGDLDVSTLSELPLGRAPITSHVVPAGDKPHFLDRAWQRIREEVAAGRQAFVVTPRIGDDEGTEESIGEDVAVDMLDDDAPGASMRRQPLAVLEVAALLREGPLADLRVEVLHGRLPSDEKDEVMRRFVNGEADVLVATTVIEVGVDVPNATVMVVMDAERFGVSQLHQLRGRIGRGSAPGLCLLVTDAEEGTPSRERLDAVAATVDGFELSRLDLQSRREGDVLGASQSGRRSSLQLLEVIKHEHVIEQAREDAANLVADDPMLERYPALRARVVALLADDRADYLEKA